MRQDVGVREGENAPFGKKSAEKAEIIAWKQRNIVKLIDGVQVCALEPK